ncbi:hypothetical protein [Roseomonas sp. HF4]|uniref:hypothetical protein n=1 Tax=Roseomonas sp. HF4 TaxID=2562313 RepID=UPI0010C04FCD|nr:hypothetical protein [Roseomonas sp. HF4]
MQALDLGAPRPERGGLVERVAQREAPVHPDCAEQGDHQRSRSRQQEFQFPPGRGGPRLEGLRDDNGPALGHGEPLEGDVRRAVCAIVGDHAALFALLQRRAPCRRDRRHGGVAVRMGDNLHPPVDDRGNGARRQVLLRKQRLQGRRILTEGKRTGGPAGMQQRQEAQEHGAAAQRAVEHVRDPGPALREHPGQRRGRGVLDLGGTRRG